MASVADRIPRPRPRIGRKSFETPAPPLSCNVHPRRKRETGVPGNVGSSWVGFSTIGIPYFVFRVSLLEGQGTRDKASAVHEIRMTKYEIARVPCDVHSPLVPRPC